MVKLNNGELQRAAAFVEQVAATLIPVIHLPQTEFGESIQFEYQPTLEFLLPSFSLYGTKKVRLAHSLDGSMLSKQE
jgi:hypothetical protein